MDTNYKILTNEERGAIEKRLLLNGSATLERDPKVAIFLAEKARDRRDDVEAYAYLLKAIRLSKDASGISDAIISEYRSEAERTPKEVLRESSYDGCLLLAKELFALQDQEERGIYYLAFAANNTSQDKFGVAARLMVDHLTDDREYAEQQRRYDQIAAKAGNPDLLLVFSAKRAV